MLYFYLKLGGEQYIKRKLMNWGIQKFPNFDIFPQYQGGRPRRENQGWSLCKSGQIFIRFTNID
jgi:hypothetical protein